MHLMQYLKISDQTYKDVEQVFRFFKQPVAGGWQRLKNGLSLMEIGVYYVNKQTYNHFPPDDYVIGFAGDKRLCYQPGNRKT